MNTLRWRGAFLTQAEIQTALELAARRKVGLRDIDPELFPSVHAWMAGRRLWGCYLLEYKEGDARGPHTDHAPGEVHLRLVCMVQPAEVGGQLCVRGGVSNLLGVVPLRAGDAVEFRADVCEHEVTRVERGTRLVITCGVVDSPSSATGRARPP